MTLAGKVASVDQDGSSGKNDLQFSYGAGGQRTMKDVLTLLTRERSIDLTGHAPGLYTAVVTTKQGRQAVRLVLASP